MYHDRSQLRSSLKKKLCIAVGSAFVMLGVPPITLFSFQLPQSLPQLSCGIVLVGLFWLAASLFSKPQFIPVEECKSLDDEEYILDRYPSTDQMVTKESIHDAIVLKINLL